MANLYELSAGYATLLDAYENAETDDEREDILAMMADTEGDIEIKAEQYAKVIKNKDADAKALREEAKRLTARAQAAENLIDRLKSALLDSMRLTGNTEINTSIGKWRVQNNPVSCEIVNIDKVPAQYHIKVEDKIDKKGLIDYYKQTGEIVDGVEFKQIEGIRFR